LSSQEKLQAYLIYLENKHLYTKQEQIQLEKAFTED